MDAAGEQHGDQRQPGGVRQGAEAQRVAEQLRTLLFRHFSDNPVQNADLEQREKFLLLSACGIKQISLSAKAPCADAKTG